MVYLLNTFFSFYNVFKEIKESFNASRHSKNLICFWIPTIRKEWGPCLQTWRWFFLLEKYTEVHVYAYNVNIISIISKKKVI